MEHSKQHRNEKLLITLELIFGQFFHSDRNITACMKLEAAFGKILETFVQLKTSQLNDLSKCPSQLLVSLC